MRWMDEGDCNRIHLAVQGSVGGTTLGLHLSANVIEDGGRVLWVGKEMPNSDRFPQLFAHLSPVAASRFHALMLASMLDKAVDALASAAKNLPSVSLIVLDDWCESSGKIPKSDLLEITRLSESVSNNIKIILISKGSIDASGKRVGEIFARSESFMESNGFEIWTLARKGDDSRRYLNTKSGITKMRIKDEGLFFDN